MADDKGAPSAPLNPNDQTDFVSRVYSTDKYSWLGPPVPSNPLTKPVDDDNVPVFIGAHGELFGLAYNEIQPREAAKALKSTPLFQTFDDTTGPQVDDYIPLPGSLVVNRFPEFADFESFHDYEVAVLDWRERMEKQVGFLRPPHTLGRSHHRPAIENGETKLPTRASSDARYILEAAEDNQCSTSSNPAAPAFSKSDVEALTEKEHTKEEDDLGQGIVCPYYWDSILMPDEPEPEFYATFEDYEVAMLRWSRLVADSEFLPPHPYQFQSMLGLRTVQPDEIGTIEDDVIVENTPVFQEEAPTTQKKTTTVTPGIVDLHSAAIWDDGLNEVLPETTYDSIESRVQMYPPRSGHPWYSTGTVTDYNDLSADTQENLSLFIEGLVDVADQHSGMGQVDPVWPLLPKIHGCFAPPSSSPLTRIYTQMAERVGEEAIRRKGLTQHQREESQIDGDKIRNQAVRYTMIPIGPDRRQGLHLKRMGVDSSYVQQLKMEDRERLDLVWRLDSESWYRPSTPLEQFEESQQAINELLSSAPFSIEVFIGIFEIPLFVDQLKTILLEPRDILDVDGAPTSVPHLLAPLTDILTPTSLETLLSVPLHTKSRTTQLKLSQVVSMLMLHETFGALVNKLAAVSATRTLYLLAHCCVTAARISTEVAPYTSYTLPLLSQACGESWTDTDSLICTQVLGYYYLSLIKKSIGNFPSAVFQNCISRSTADTLIPPLLTDTTTTLTKLLSSHVAFLGGIAFRCLASPSKKASATMLVLLTTLLGMTDVYKVIEAVRSPRTGFVNQIRNLALSRLSHAQFAASSLFKCLQTGPWELFLVSQYTTQDLIRIDLTQHLTVARAPTPMGKSKAWQSVTAAFKNPTSTLALSNLPSQLNLEYPDLPGRVVQNQLNELAMAPPLLCRLVSEMIIPQAQQAALGSCSPQHVHLLDAGLFHTLLKTLLNHKDTPSESILVISKTLEAITRAFAYKQLITTTQTPYNLTARANGQLPTPPTQLPIHFQDISALIAVCQQEGKTDAGQRFRTSCLVTLRHVLKKEQTFQLVRAEPDFFYKLLQFCRDRSDRNFNRNAWRLFYQSIRYHTGVADHLIKSGHMQQFFETVEINHGPIVFGHGLHYLSKLFRMFQLEQKHLLNGRTPSRAELDNKQALNSMEKDQKILIQFYLKAKIFIKSHMIYKHLMQDKAGYSWLALSRFYHTIATSPGCSKLYKDLSKSVEFKEGFQAVMESFTARERTKTQTGFFKFIRDKH